MKSSLKKQSDFAKFRSLRGYDVGLLVSAFFVLLVYKGLLLVYPFNKFVAAKPGQDGSANALPNDKIDRMTWAIRVVSARIPLGFTCLVQALSAKWLLKNPEVQICIGVQKSETDQFSAHAWVVYRGRTILGEQANQVFQPIMEWN
ncbi:lasso peptide biosynthesis B2 protein [Spirosoma fluminis]